MKDEFEDELSLDLALEEFDDECIVVTTEIMARIDRIRAVGICREDYDVLEQHIPGIFANIDRRKLTVQPSKTQHGLAMEAFGLKEIGMATGSVAVIAALYKLIQWVREKLNSTGGGGGGESAKLPMKELATTVRRENKETVKAVVKNEAIVAQAVRTSSKDIPIRETVEGVVRIDSNGNAKDKDRQLDQAERLFKTYGPRGMAAYNMLVSEGMAPSDKKIPAILKLVCSVNEQELPIAIAMLTRRGVTSGAILVVELSRDEIPSVPYKDITGPEKLLQSFSALLTSMVENGRLPTNAKETLTNIGKYRLVNAKETSRVNLLLEKYNRNNRYSFHNADLPTISDIKDITKAYDIVGNDKMTGEDLDEIKDIISERNFGRGKVNKDVEKLLQDAAITAEFNQAGRAVNSLVRSLAKTSTTFVRVKRDITHIKTAVDKFDKNVKNLVTKLVNN